LRELIENNIDALVDVRRNAFSMKHGFSKSQLRDYAEKTDIRYLHLPNLGIPSNMRHNLQDPQAYRKLFEYYESEILPNQEEDIEYIRSLLDRYARIALTCFERDFHLCHRHKITGYLENLPDFGMKVIHL